jgi:hypothetical protein
MILKNLAFTLVAVTVLLSGCSQIQTKKIDDTHFILTHSYNEPPRDLASRALASKASELCPSGYDVLSKNAAKKAEFGYSDDQCVAYKHCDYVLEWRISCADKPKDDFSIFGKH